MLSTVTASAARLRPGCTASSLSVHCGGSPLLQPGRLLNVAEKVSLVFAKGQRSCSLLLDVSLNGSNCRKLFWGQDAAHGKFTKI